MTTRHEGELQEIERMIKRPRKGEQVTEGMRKFVEAEREKERDRHERTKELGTTISLRWVNENGNIVDGEPTKWEPATVEVTIGGKTRVYFIEPYQERDGKMRLDPRLVRVGYAKMAEEWAMWKWHGDRGSEINDVDEYILDCPAPKMKWLPVLEPRRKAEEAA